MYKNGVKMSTTNKCTFIKEKLDSMIETDKLKVNLTEMTTSCLVDELNKNTEERSILLTELSIRLDSLVYKWITKRGLGDEIINETKQIVNENIHDSLSILETLDKSIDLNSSYDNYKKEILTKYIDILITMNNISILDTDQHIIAKINNIYRIGKFANNEVDISTRIGNLIKELCDMILNNLNETHGVNSHIATLQDYFRDFQIWMYPECFKVLITFIKDSIINDSLNNTEQEKSSIINILLLEISD